MTPAQRPAAAGWLTLTSVAVTAVVVGFASTILVVMQALRAVHATPAQQISAAAALCFGMAGTTLYLSWRHRMPIITAWSTPGAALIATSAAGVSYDSALGAFVFAGGLMALTALVTPLARAIGRIPPAIAGAMLAGVLLHYTLGVPSAAVAMPFTVLPLVVVFFGLRLRFPLYAVPVVVGLGVILALMSGAAQGACCTVGLTSLQWTTPRFDPATLLSLGVPLFLVTMASQNLPGFAVLRASGYEAPVTSCLLTTGLASALLAPFGAHAINMAAIIASIACGPDGHPDPNQRWLVAWPFFGLYVVVGLLTAVFVQLLGTLPPPLITTIAGLALFSPLMAGLASMVKELRDIESAAVTFMITASGISLGGVGSAFWGLLAGLILFGMRHAVSRPGA
jgi:benzoate membrane transport protein